MVEQGSGPAVSAASLAETFASHAPLDAKAHHQEAWTLDVNAPIDSHAHIGKNRGNNRGEVIASFAISIWMHASIITVSILTVVVSALMPYCMPPPPAQSIQKVDVKVVELAPPPPQIEEPRVAEVSGGRRAESEASAIALASPAKKKNPGQRVRKIKEAELNEIAAVLSASSESSALRSADDLSASGIRGGLIGRAVGETSGYGGLGLRGTAVGGEGSGGSGGLGLRGTGIGGGGTANAENVTGFGGGGIGGSGKEVTGFGTIRKTALDAEDPARRDEVRRVMAESVPKITECYKTTVAKKEELEGRTMLLIFVDDDGRVASATLRPKLDSELDECILRIIRGLSFPKGKTTIRYPLTFRRS